MLTRPVQSSTHSVGPAATLHQFDCRFQTPNRPVAAHGLPACAAHARHPSISPPSIAEAAELASLQRRNNGLRGATLRNTDESVPATPDTDLGASDHVRVAKARTASHQAHPPSSTSFASLESKPRRHPLSDSWPHPTPARSNPSRTARQGHAFSASVLDGPGVSATPPIAETDLEPIGPFSADDDALLPARPHILDTVSTQDASLPSPSLSPITAAAHLAQSTSHRPSFAADERADDRGDDSIASAAPLDRADGVHPRGRRFDAKQWELLDRGCQLTPQTQPPTPSLMDMPMMLDTFDSMPEELKTYTMFQLLRRCAKPTLHFVANVVNPALKCDFLRLLPLELSLNIVRHLDCKSLCSAAQVSKKWRSIIDTDETTWKERMEKDGYVLPEGELEQAVKEGWGWQYPHSADSYERDLRTASRSVRSDSENSPVSAGWGAGADADWSAAQGPGRWKRKSTSKHGLSNKKLRRKGGHGAKCHAPQWSSSVGSRQGPNAMAEIAAATVPSPNVGLPSLRHMHLFKTLYLRHHLIHKGWMDEATRPKHLAFRGHQRRHVVTSLQFDSDKIITGSDDTSINVYDTKTGALRARLEGHEGGVWTLEYRGNTLVSGSTDRTVRVWDLDKAKCTHVFQGHQSTVRCLVILQPTTPAGADSAAFPTDPLVITGSRDSSLRVWKLPRPGDRPFIQTSPSANDHDNPFFVRALSGHSHSVRAIAAHGDTLVSGSYDLTVRVWRIHSGAVVHRLQGHTQKVYSVVLDPPRNRCISGSMDNLVKVWSLETGACLFNLEGHTSLVGLLELGHGRLVSAAADSTLRIWDPENGHCKSTLCAHTGAITCFQHDGQKVISGSDRTLKMWNVQTGEFVKDLMTDLSGVWQVKFNDRRCVAAVQRDDTTYIEVGARLGRKCIADQRCRCWTLAHPATGCRPTSLGAELSSTTKDAK